MVALIGSSILKPSAKLPKPCHSSSDSRIQSDCSPIPSGTKRFGPQTLNHQSSRPYSEATLRMARRKSRASLILSSTKAVPPGGSIIAAATSQEAIMAYCGEVEVCIKKASLKILRSNLRDSDSCTIICEACEIPANNLCVECVANTIASG